MAMETSVSSIQQGRKEVFSKSDPQASGKQKAFSKNLSQQMHASHVKQHICGTVQVGGMSDITGPNTRDVHRACVERHV